MKLYFSAVVEFTFKVESICLRFEIHKLGLVSL